MKSIFLKLAEFAQNFTIGNSDSDSNSLGLALNLTGELYTHPFLSLVYSD